jgi:cytochrome c oxidase subunit 2
VPGHRNLLRIQADQPGEYAGQCNEFCGIGHAQMHFTVIVDRPEDFPAAVKSAAANGEVKK